MFATKASLSAGSERPLGHTRRAQFLVDRDGLLPVDAAGSAPVPRHRNSRHCRPGTAPQRAVERGRGEDGGAVESPPASGQVRWHNQLMGLARELTRIGTSGGQQPPEMWEKQEENAAAAEGVVAATTATT